MPQATEQLRAEWPGGDKEAINYLQQRGYRLDRRWAWVLPHPAHVPTPIELSAVRYLIDEWDFDGILLVHAGKKGGSHGG
jgi:hypothetical protein